MKSEAIEALHAHVQQEQWAPVRGVPRPEGLEGDVALLQVAIALGALAALTRRRAVWLFSTLIGVAGTALLAIGFLGLVT